MKIIIDDREIHGDTLFVDALKLEAARRKCEVSIERLQVGDVVCAEKNGGPVVERKSQADFYSSIIDGRLQLQAKNMRESYQQATIIIVGSFLQFQKENEKTRKIDENVYCGAISSICSKYGVSIIVCETYTQAAYITISLLEKFGEPIEKTVKRLEFSTEDLKLAALTSVRGVSSERAKNILQKFPSLKSVCDASEKELQEIDGIGKVLAKNIKLVFV